MNMSTLVRTAVLAGLVLAGVGTFFTAGVEPAAAECKYGTPHCITKSLPNPVKGVGGASLPGTGWVDADCAEFGNCDSSELKGTEFRRPSGTPVGVTPGGNRIEKH
jgi:hypothetical protein